MDNKYTIDINVSVKARDQVEANQKFIGMISKLSLLLGLTDEKLCDSVCDGQGILNFEIKKK